jgi:hypothetical protein
MSVRTVRRWIADEILPSAKLGGARLVARADLEVLLSLSHEASPYSFDNMQEYDESSEL